MCFKTKLVRRNAATQNLHYIYKSKVECPFHTHSEHIVFAQIGQNLANYSKNQKLSAQVWD